MKKLIYSTVILSFILSVQTLFAQGLSNNLSELSDVAAKPYLAPAISAFGSNLNSGWVSGLPSPDYYSFHLNVKIVGMGSFFNSDQKTFNQNGIVSLNNDEINSLLLANGITQGNPNYSAYFQSLKLDKLNVNFSGPYYCW